MVSWLWLQIWTPALLCGCYFCSSWKPISEKRNHIIKKIIDTRIYFRLYILCSNTNSTIGKGCAKVITVLVFGLHCIQPYIVTGKHSVQWIHTLMLLSHTFSYIQYHCFQLLLTIVYSQNVANPVFLIDRGAKLYLSWPNELVITNSNQFTSRFTAYLQFYASQIKYGWFFWQRHDSSISHAAVT